MQLRQIASALASASKLEARRRSIIGSLRSQGLLTSKLQAALQAAGTTAVLEDLYLPFKPKKGTRASAARDKGLGPLAQQLLKAR